MLRPGVLAASNAARSSSRSIGTAPGRSLIDDLRRNPELDADEARNELRWITHSLGTNASFDKVNELVQRRARGEPLQYVLGSTDFGPLTLRCRAPTLIPRPETAEVFRRLASLLEACRIDVGDAVRPINIVDLCTGSAPIPLLLKHLLGDKIRTFGYDLSVPAIQLANQNIASNELDVQVHLADILQADFPHKVISDLNGRVDVLVSNPPYITGDEYRSLPPSVTEWEDPAALLGDLGRGSKGLEFYERIAGMLPTLLSDDREIQQAGWTRIPRIALEIGAEQGADVQSILRAARMGRTEVWRDQYDRDRLVLGWTTHEA